VTSTNFFFSAQGLNSMTVAGVVCNKAGNIHGAKRFSPVDMITPTTIEMVTLVAKAGTVTKHTLTSLVPMVTSLTKITINVPDNHVICILLPDFNQSWNV
jgi:hypothetical protein